MDIHRLNQRTAAELLGVTARSLRDWATAPRNSDGSYDGPALVQWKLAQSAGDLDPAYERARRDKATADRIEHDLSVKRGEVVPLAEAEQEWTRMIGAARLRLLRLPTDCAASVGASHAVVVQAAVKVAVHEALTELAGYNPDPPDAA